MNDMKWFRFYSEFVDDPKIAMMTDSDQLLWVKALCLASDSKLRGYITLSDDEICWKLRITIETWKHAVDKFRAKGMIEHTDKGYRITNWDKRQFSSDSSTERVKKHRQKKKEATQPEKEQIQPETTETSLKRFTNVFETPPDTDPDTDTDLPLNPPQNFESEREGEEIFSELEKSDPPEQGLSQIQIPDVVARLNQVFSVTQTPDCSDQSSAAPVPDNFFEENLKAQSWDLEAVPWKLPDGRYRESMVQAVYEAYPNGTAFRLANGDRNEITIGKHIRNHEEKAWIYQSQTAINARRTLLEYWERAKLIEQRQAEKVLPVAADDWRSPLSPPTPEPEEDPRGMMIARLAGMIKTGIPQMRATAIARAEAEGISLEELGILDEVMRR